MTRVILLKCDHCYEQAEVEEHQEPAEYGWHEVLKYDSMSEEMKALDFCSDECISSYFG